MSFPNHPRQARFLSFAYVDQSGRFSRDDSLKRHIMKLHVIFLILFGEKYTALFRLLQPRIKNQVEDLHPLVVMGPSLQAQARQWGVPIKDKEDLREIHLDMAKMMRMSLP